MGLAVVPLSGGWDSACCLAKAVQRHGKENVISFYAYYGATHEQQDKEREASSRIAGVFQVRHRWERLETSIPIGKVFPGRNHSILSRCASNYPGREVYFGSRNPFWFFDEYGDSNWLWGKIVAKELGITLRTPCMGRSKAWIINQVLKAGVPRSYIHSTEKGY